MATSKDSKIVIVGIILGVSLLLSTALASLVFWNARSQGSLSVTGSARQSVVADNAKWTGSWTRRVTVANLKAGYASIAKDEALVTSFLQSKGISADEMSIGPVSMDEVYKYNDTSPSTEREYNLHQSVLVSSNDVEKITGLAKNTKALVDNGVIFSTGNPEYYYSKLADLRVSLLGNAIRDAEARADKIASAGGKKLGNLVSAASGVVQVLPAGSVEVSDYGSYDTGSINKEVMITVKAGFELR
ncbi:MAG: SIMPL domain-containing protein [bacterium]